MRLDDPICICRPAPCPRWRLPCTPALRALLTLLVSTGCSTVWGFEPGSTGSGTGVGGSAGSDVGGSGASAGSGASGGCSGLETLVLGERVGPGIHSGVTSDTFLREDVPANCYGDEPSLWLFGDAGTARVTLLRFDLSSLPTDAVIESAELRLFVCSDPTCAISLSDLSLFRVLEAWDETGASWNERQAGVAWSTPGAGAPASTDATPTQTLSLSVYAPSTEIPIVLDAQGVALVQDWVANPTTNFGVALAIDGDDGGLQSSESATTTERPLLVIEVPCF